jgi:hypothetical protein
MPDELDALLDAFDEAERSRSERQADAAARIEAQNAAAARRVAEEIVPVLEDIASRLRDRGHFADVESSGSSAEIRFVPRNAVGASERPHLLFTVNDDLIVVRGSVVSSTRTGSSRGDSFPLDALSEQLLRERTVAWVGEVLAVGQRS